MAPQPYEVGSSKFPLENSDESALLNKIEVDEILDGWWLSVCGPVLLKSEQKNGA